MEGLCCGFQGGWFIVCEQPYPNIYTGVSWQQVPVVTRLSAIAAVELDVWVMIERRIKP
jgi:hypothetical protein